MDDGNWNIKRKSAAAEQTACRQIPALRGDQSCAYCLRIRFSHGVAPAFGITMISDRGFPGFRRAQHLIVMAGVRWRTASPTRKAIPSQP